MSAEASDPADGLLRASVHGELRRRFVTGQVMPGTSLSTRRLALELGVSQMPVREALGRLAAEGAVEIRSKRKIVVPPMTQSRFQDLLRCREILEPEAAATAVRHIDAPRLRRLRAIDDEIGDALRDGDVGAYMARNYDFHFLIYRALPRPTLVQLIETLWLQFGPYMRVVHGRFGTSRLDDQHERALIAIRDRNGPALRRAVLADIRDGMSLIAKNGFETGL